MGDELEDVHDAFPNRLARNHLADGHRLCEMRREAVQLLDGALKLVCGYFHGSGLKLRAGFKRGPLIFLLPRKPIPPPLPPPTATPPPIPNMTPYTRTLP